MQFYFAADFDGTKQKRSDRGSVGLFPFPRVGRSDPDAVPEIDPSYAYMSVEDYGNLIIYLVLVCNLKCYSGIFIHRSWKK